MATQTVLKKVSVNRAEPVVQDLIRSLLDNAKAVNAAAFCSPSGPECEELLLDVDVDGSRYLLVRLPIVDRPQIQLSPREQEIVRMVAQGHPNKVIAEVLSISAWTVCTHLRRIFAKVGVGSRAAMVARLFDGRAGKTDSPQMPVWPTRHDAAGKEAVRKDR